MPKTPEALLPRIEPVLESGIGLLVSILARPTHEEAVNAASAMLDAIGGKARRTHKEFAQHSDSVAFTSTLAMAEESATDSP